jgi:hypothetical protein
VEIPERREGDCRRLRQPDSDIYVRKVEKKDGELWNTVIKLFGLAVLE